jgi:preprotein translocase subunit SecD
MKSIPMLYRILIVLGVLVVSTALIFVDLSDIKDPKVKSKTNVNLGLDLRGGSYLVMQVQTPEALRDVTDLVAERIDGDLRERKIFSPQFDAPAEPGQAPAQGVVRDGDVSIVVNLPPGAPTDDLQKTFDHFAPGWTMETLEAGRRYRLTMPTRMQADTRDSAVSATVETIRNRVDQFGVAEPLINRQGAFGSSFSDRIVLQLPGVENPGRVKDLIRSQAKLEWKDMTYPPGLTTGRYDPPASKEALIAQFGGALPPDTEAYPTPGGYDATGQETARWWPLKKASVVSGNDLRDAREQEDIYKGWAVHFVLTPTAGARFRDYTAAHIGKIAAIVLDGKVISAPTIQSMIAGEGEITGSFTKESAKDLALKLKSGALKASVKVIEERTVGPSLGLDSIRKGILASVVGFLAVMAFMLVYYKGSGLNAVLALALNVVILLGIMSYFHATLTLPGIAGLILTVGMAVDSNVLIFERIREELRLGKTVRAAIDAGFGRVFITIVDTHVTTLGSAACLYLYGTGPVKGFAVTLIIGLLASMFTSVFVSRVIYDIVLSLRPKGETLSI